MEKFLVGSGIAMLLVLLVGIYTTPNNGIHTTSPNVALIEGECIVINWDATPREAEQAIERWHQLKKR